MGIVAKSAAGVVGAGSIAAGGFGINHLMNVEPKVITLEQASTKPESGKWWDDDANRKKLVANDDENRPWWNWKYKHAFRPFKEDESKKTSLDTHFASVRSGYSRVNSNEDKSLNQACWEVYGKEKSEVSSNTNLKDNAEKFCAVEVKAE